MEARRIQGCLAFLSFDKQWRRDYAELNKDFDHRRCDSGRFEITRIEMSDYWSHHAIKVCSINWRNSCL